MQNVVGPTLVVMATKFGLGAELPACLGGVEQRCLVSKVQQRQMPDIGMLFLNLKVRRSHLVSDSLNEVSIVLCS